MKKNEMLDTDEAALETGLTLHNGNGNLQMVPLDPKNIDQLETFEKAEIDLISNYWTPETVGETKRVIFDRLGVTKVLDNGTGEVIDLECAFFFVKENGATKQLVNGSKRLVGALASLPQYTPLQITYLGKKSNSTNSFKSDHWVVNPLTPKK